MKFGFVCVVLSILFNFSIKLSFANPNKALCDAIFRRDVNNVKKIVIEVADLKFGIKLVRNFLRSPDRSPEDRDRLRLILQILENAESQRIAIPAAASQPNEESNPIPVTDAVSLSEILPPAANADLINDLFSGIRQNLPDLVSGSLAALNSRGFNVNNQRQQGTSAFSIALRTGNRKIIEILFDGGARITRYRSLTEALYHGDITSVSDLLQEMGPRREDHFDLLALAESHPFPATARDMVSLLSIYLFSYAERRNDAFLDISTPENNHPSSRRHLWQQIFPGTHN